MSRLSQAVSLTAHTAAIALLILLAIRPRPIDPPRDATHLVDPLPFRPHQPAGGGGMREPDPPMRGVLPPRSERVFTPPLIQRAVFHPQIEVPLTIDAPPEMRSDAVALVGDPHGLGTVLSSGPGGPAGIGVGVGRTIGPGTGEHQGPGVDGVFSAGHGVTAPVPIRMVEPEYSEQARKLRLSGTVLVYAEIDAQGVPRNLRIVQSMGLGLDEKALEAVAKWLFKPGTKDGRPVTVRANVEVNFRLL